MHIGKNLKSRYHLVKKLDEGGFGKTYLAKDLDLPSNPTLVVKHLSPQDSSPEVLSTAEKLFDREAKCLDKLGKQHPQIPTLYAYFREEGEFYLVQEYIEGHPLSKELIQGKQWNESDVILLLQDILQVLEFVHKNQAIHRDLKPANLIRRSCDGKIVLIDFGAVKQVSTQATNFQGKVASTVAVGTHGYMPSEQATGYPQPCSDIYALGIIAIKALTGIIRQDLPKNNDTLEVMWRNQAPHVSYGLAKVLDKMVCYDCRDRYQNASEALEDVEMLKDKVVVTVSEHKSEDWLKSNYVFDSLDSTIAVGA